MGELTHDTRYCGHTCNLISLIAIRDYTQTLCVMHACYEGSMLGTPDLHTRGFKSRTQATHAMWYFILNTPVSQVSMRDTLSATYVNVYRIKNS